MAGGDPVVLVEDITERLKAEARISHLAPFHSLTYLPNQPRFPVRNHRLLSPADLHSPLPYSLLHPPLSC